MYNGIIVNLQILMCLSMYNYIYEDTRMYEIYASICVNCLISINQCLFSIQTDNNNIHTFVNLNTERAGTKVILLI